MMALDSHSSNPSEALVHPPPVSDQFNPYQKNSCQAFLSLSDNQSDLRNHIDHNNCCLLSQENLVSLLLLSEFEQLDMLCCLNMANKSDITNFGSVKNSSQCQQCLETSKSNPFAVLKNLCDINYERSTYSHTIVRITIIISIVMSQQFCASCPQRCNHTK